MAAQSSRSCQPAIICAWVLPKRDMQRKFGQSVMIRSDQVRFNASGHPDGMLHANSVDMYN